MPPSDRIMRRASSLMASFWNSLFKQENPRRMRNLAGRSDSDRIIALELDRAELAVVRHDCPLGELPSLLIGRLGPIDFVRESTYYVVAGPIPIEVARDLYRDPIGQCDALIHGNRNRPAPEVPWVAWYTNDGARIYPRVQEVAFLRLQATCPAAFLHAPPPVFHDQPEAIGAIGFVDWYHVISEDGLQVFASMLRRHAVDSRALPSWWDQDRFRRAQWDPFSAQIDTHRDPR